MNSTNNEKPDTIPPRSEKYDDIYFSAGGGREETRHVFINGNNLPQAWKNKTSFVIAETGFGTGLNFLTLEELFNKDPGNCKHIDYISFEKYPLSAEEIKTYLSPVLGENHTGLKALLKNYPLRTPGVHTIEHENGNRLILVFGDVNETMEKLKTGVNAWFLDGFTPSKNPDIWTDKVFSEMARLTAPEGTFSTYTAAGFVKKGLAKAGFFVERVKGFGQKKHMLNGKIITSGTLEGQTEEIKNEKNNDIQRIKNVAIVGAGLAGTSCAWLLKKHGINSVIFEATNDVAGGASGNAVGIFNPRLSMGRTPQSEFYSSAYSLTIKTIKEIQQTNDVKYKQCGTLHLVNSAQKEKRFKNVLDSWGWHTDHMRYLDSDQASIMAKVPVHNEALYLPDSGSVSPADLCAAYSEGIDVRLGVQLMMNDISREKDCWKVLDKKYDAIILACGEGAKWFEETEWLPVHTVRGQIIQAEDSGFGDDLACNICYGGYISPGESGIHTLGSTFQKWLTHTDATEEDNDEIIGRLREALPEADGGIHAVNARAGLRTQAKDHFPIAGAVPDLTSWELGTDKYIPSLYLTTAHGSHGIVSSIAAAHLVIDQLLGRIPGMSQPVIDQLNASRFLKRARKKGQMDIFRKQLCKFQK